MEFIVQEMDKDEDSTLTAAQIVKRVSMLKAINWISESWNELKPETITRWEIETNRETTDEDILEKVRRELGTDKEIDTVEDEEEEEDILF